MTRAIINNGDSGLTVRNAINANFAELYLPAPFATVATSSGAQTITLPSISRAYLAINGLMQRPQDVVITASVATLAADLLITAGDVLLFIPF